MNLRDARSVRPARRPLCERRCDPNAVDHVEGGRHVTHRPPSGCSSRDESGGCGAVSTATAPSFPSSESTSAPPRKPASTTPVATRLLSGFARRSGISRSLAVDPRSSRRLALTQAGPTCRQGFLPERVRSCVPACVWRRMLATRPFRAHSISCPLLTGTREPSQVHHRRRRGATLSATGTQRSRAREAFDAWTWRWRSCA